MPDFEPIRVARANERRQAAATSELAEEVRPIAGGVMTFSRGVPWINHATGVGFEGAASEADVVALESFYRERGSAPKIELTIFAGEEFLGLLGSRGFVVEHFETVLARPLRAGEDPFAGLRDGLARGLVIERTDPADEERCREHSRLVASGFMPGPIPEEMIEMGVRAIRHPRTAAFMAFVDGGPAGACGMEVGEHAGVRVCALWGTTVLGPFRRRGVQQALIAHRLAHGLSRGCELAIIESKPAMGTERNAARLGFGLSYVRACMEQRGAAQ